MSEATVSSPGEPRFVRAMKALNDRRMASMLLLAFIAGLPMGVTLGLLNAWLTEEGVTPATIGALSLIGIGYAFKYLWAPAFQSARPIKGMESLGGRRSWLIVLQAIMVVMIAVFAFTDPARSVAIVTIMALAIALISPTHDLILDAWRIEVARSGEDKDLMSALYQFGYKSAGFVTGFFALLMAARYGWTVVFLMVAVFLAIAMVGSLVAPEPHVDEATQSKRLSYLPSLSESISGPAIMAISIGWLIAFSMIGWFMIEALILENGASGRTFVREQGPWIVLFTVIMPAAVSALLVFRFQAKPTEIDLRDTPASRSNALLGTLFRAIFDPLMELIQRLRWGALLVLCLALTYRFTDAVWGSFAYPFYLGENHGAIGHTLDDVAIASKFFGVLATILGSLIGAVMIGALGRMPVLFIGGIVAAATNLLYADLAAGAAKLDWFLAVSRLDMPLIAFADWAATIQVDVTAVDQGQRMARLMITIFAENIAGGLALVAVMAYLTSVVNPRFAAVQYALLASLSMLIGTLGRPWLGELIESQGFYTVFVITFWLGGVAVVLSALEWIRQVRAGSQELVLEQSG
ncbi:MAG: beta-lactamase induction signal transducer [Pseudomonadota bacterium]